MSEPRFCFVARVAAGDAGGGAQVGWRLLGRNNHEIARSVDGYEDVSAAERAVDALLLVLDRLEPSVRADGPDRRWTWQVSLDEVTVAVAGRSYPREREARLGVERFVGVAREAEVSGRSPRDRSGPTGTTRPS